MAVVRRLPTADGQPEATDSAVAAEQAVIGALLLGAPWSDVASVLIPAHFSRSDHALIFAAMGSLVASGQRIDIITLQEHLRRFDQLDNVGSLAYLATIARETAVADNVRAHAEIVLERALRRRLQELVSDSRLDTPHLVEQLERDVAELKALGAGSQAVPRFDPRRAGVNRTLLDQAPDTVEQIVRNLLRRTAGVRVSPGGTGKSTLTLYEMICIIQAADLYGNEVMRPGPCVLLTAEDERQVAEYRLWRIMEDLKLSRPQREHVIDNLHIEDLTSSTCRFVDVGDHGSLVHTPAVAEFIECYSPIKPAFVSIDPMIFFGPGERFVNDGEGELMRAGRRISAGLNAAVRFEHHTGKGQARERSVDQYTGRGGSAGADNARFVHVLQVHDAKDNFTAPARCTPEDIAKGHVLRLHVAKDSYGARLAAPIWILRCGFGFTHIRPDPVSDADPMQAQLKSLHAFIEAEEAKGIKHTGSTLENCLLAIGLSRAELRATLNVARQRKHLIEQELPKEEQQGQRKTYLARGLVP